MYMLIKTFITKDDDNYDVSEDEILFGGEDPEVMEIAANLLTGAAPETQLGRYEYNVQELAMLTRRDLLRLGEFMNKAGVSP